MQIRPSKGLIAKFVQRKELRIAGVVPATYPQLTEMWGTRNSLQIKSHHNGGLSSCWRSISISSVANWVDRFGRFLKESELADPFWVYWVGGQFLDGRN